MGVRRQRMDQERSVEVSRDLRPGAIVIGGKRRSRFETRLA